MKKSMTMRAGIEKDFLVLSFYDAFGREFNIVRWKLNGILFSTNDKLREILFSVAYPLMINKCTNFYSLESNVYAISSLISIFCIRISHMINNQLWRKK